MANFDYALKKTLKWEGGFQKMAKDTGNYNSRGELVGTNRGISAKLYERIIGRPPSEQDMRNISEETAKKIYKTAFWDKMHGDKFLHDDVAANIFDWYVNAGTWGIYYSKKAAGKFSKNIQASHSMTVNDVNTLNSLSQTALFEAIKQERIEYYRRLVAKKPEHSVFITGWLNRANSFFLTENS